MKKMKLYHGSEKIIQTPSLAAGRPDNDFGQGFYCTPDRLLGAEWACKRGTDGFVNEYSLNTESLNVINLLDSQYSVLNWIALLLKNRTFNLDSDFSRIARDFILEHYLPDLSPFDLVIGYRADDSYFSYAQSFLMNSLPLRRLEAALHLGNLGTQLVLRSDNAFKHLHYENTEPVSASRYYAQFARKDYTARAMWKHEIKHAASYKNDCFIIDILRNEGKP